VSQKLYSALRMSCSFRKVNNQKIEIFNLTLLSAAVKNAVLHLKIKVSSFRFCLGHFTALTQYNGVQ
jgi:hypothetical protein